jgi:hypothetical protein
VRNIARLWVQKLRKFTKIYAFAAISLTAQGLRYVSVNARANQSVTFCRCSRLSRVFRSERMVAMKNSNDSLFGFALTVVALVALLTVSHSWERSVSPLTVTQSSVSELRLRLSMQR